MPAEKPSILFIFQRMRWQMPLLGAILAIAMGFDLITREKESHSLKSLLSHPVFRDEIINGKALGGILVLKSEKVMGVFKLLSYFPEPRSIFWNTCSTLLFYAVPSKIHIAALTPKCLAFFRGYKGKR
jgi:ABC-type Na+ efflux pump permease subunit